MKSLKLIVVAIFAVALALTPHAVCERRRAGPTARPPTLMTKSAGRGLAITASSKTKGRPILMPAKVAAVLRAAQ